jgi:hypothetical protein
MERGVLREEEDEQASGAIVIEDVEDFLIDTGASSDAAQEEAQEVRASSVRMRPVLCS